MLEWLVDYWTTPRGRLWANFLQSMGVLIQGGFIVGLIYQVHRLRNRVRTLEQKDQRLSYTIHRPKSE